MCGQPSGSGSAGHVHSGKRERWRQGHVTTAALAQWNDSETPLPQRGCHSTHWPHHIPSPRDLAACPPPGRRAGLASTQLEGPPRCATARTEVVCSRAGLQAALAASQEQRADERRCRALLREAFVATKLRFRCWSASPLPRACLRPQQASASLSQASLPSPRANPGLERCQWRRLVTVHIVSSCTSQYCGLPPAVCSTCRLGWTLTVDWNGASRSERVALGPKRISVPRCCDITLPSRRAGWPAR